MDDLTGLLRTIYTAVILGPEHVSGAGNGAERAWQRTMERERSGAKTERGAG